MMVWNEKYLRLCFLISKNLHGDQYKLFLDKAKVNARIQELCHLHKNVHVRSSSPFNDASFPTKGVAMGF